MPEEKLCVVVQSLNESTRSYTGRLQYPCYPFLSSYLYETSMKDVVIHDADRRDKTPTQLHKLWKNSPKRREYQLKPEDGIILRVSDVYPKDS